MYVPRQISQEAIIPATPGFYRLILSFDPSEDGEPWVGKSAIIAWRIISIRAKNDPEDWAAGYPDPICLEPEWGDGRLPTAILCPDGTIEAQADTDYASQAAWVEAEKARIIALREKAAAPEAPKAAGRAE